uniref:Transposase-associated domain-containing protein n=1 Tax=Ananas comosus var. bracteatus TaxID=296719 RepID=A0A6V7P1W0_ANACO|nr:unnamed protein product [Ananas comosus var. bracteatus]
MDKTWILKPRSSADYQQGLDQFLKFAFDNASKESMILCPCRKCTNCFWKEEEVVYEHLLCDGFMQGYTRWIFHGEDTSQSNPTNKANIQNEQINDEMDELLHDSFFHPESDFDVGDLDTNDLTTEPDEETKKFYKLVKDANQEIYPGCKKFSKLSFIVRLLQIKCLGGWSNKNFDMLLKLLKEVLPAGETLPSSFYETDKIIKDLGLGYEKIDACPNNCMLYRKEFANASLCHVCGASRWKTIESKVSIKKSKEKHGHKPIGDEAAQFTNFLGTIARSGKDAPLTYKDWRHMPLDNKKIMWNIVKLKYNLGDDSWPWVMKALGKKWKDFKSDLKKKHYDAHNTYEDRLADRDSRVLPEQWRQLIEYWDSEEGQREIDVKTKNQPALAQKGAKEVNDLFSEIFGKEKHGRVRGLGLGPAPTHIWTDAPSPAACIRMATEARKKAEEETKEMKERMMVMETQLAEMKAMMTAMLQHKSTDFHQTNYTPTNPLDGRQV